MKVIVLNRVDNKVAKGEIAHDEQYLLLSQCFQKMSAPGLSKKINMCEKVISGLSKCFVITDQMRKVTDQAWDQIKGKSLEGVPGEQN